MDAYKYINPNNLFEDEEDERVADYIVVMTNRTRNPPLSAMAMSPSDNIPHEANTTNMERRHILEKQREIEQRTLKSSAQSIKILLDTENIGITTTKELARQGEALNNTTRYIDEINTNLKSSQKNISGMQSVVQGVKNQIYSKYKQRVPQSQASSDSRSNRVVADTSKYTALEHSGPMSARLREVKKQSMLDPVNQMLDENLDEMANAIARLKNIGITLGQEINQQNDLIDVIRDKVEGTDIKIGSQITQMKRLQKK